MIIIINLILKIQYPMGKPSGQNDAIYPYLSIIVIQKKDRTCQGIKMCEFVSSELARISRSRIRFMPKNE